MQGGLFIAGDADVGARARTRGRARAGWHAAVRAAGAGPERIGAASTPIVLADCLPELCLLPNNLNVEAGMAVGNW